MDDRYPSLTGRLRELPPQTELRITAPNPWPPYAPIPLEVDYTPTERRILANAIVDGKAMLMGFDDRDYKKLIAHFERWRHKSKGYRKHIRRQKAQQKRVPR